MEQLKICPYCGLPFKTEENLKLHIANWHNEEAAKKPIKEHTHLEPVGERENSADYNQSIQSFQKKIDEFKKVLCSYENSKSSEASYARQIDENNNRYMKNKDVWSDEYKQDWYKQNEWLEGMRWEAHQSAEVSSPEVAKWFRYFETIFIPGADQVLQLIDLIEGYPMAISIARRELQNFKDDRIEEKLIALLEAEDSDGKDELISLMREKLKRKPDDRLKQKLLILLLRTGLVQDALAMMKPLQEQSRTAEVNLLQSDTGEGLDNQQIRELLRTCKEALSTESVNNQNLVLDSLRKLLSGRDSQSFSESRVWLGLVEKEMDEDLRLEGIKLTAWLYPKETWSILAIYCRHDKSEKILLYAAETLRQYTEDYQVNLIVKWWLKESQLNTRVRTAIMATLREVDKRPRRWWEKLVGRRPWAK